MQEMRDYYGEELAFYFAWMQFYTLWLIPIALKQKGADIIIA